MQRVVKSFIFFLYIVLTLYTSPSCLKDLNSYSPLQFAPVYSHCSVQCSEILMELHTHVFAKHFEYRKNNDGLKKQEYYQAYHMHRIENKPTLYLAFICVSFNTDDLKLIIF